MIRRACLLTMLVAAVLAWLAFGTPPPAVPTFQAVRAAHRPSDLQLLDRHGALLHELRIDETARRLAWTALADISPALQAAVIASEDRRFFRHGGVDLEAMAAALLQWRGGGPRRGASTITMQVATLLDARLRRSGGPRTLPQKWRQMRLAWAIEGRWSKAEILEAYLNRVTFRGELQGVAAASAVLFGKAPHGITEGEGAILAALIRAPNAGRATVARRATALLKAQGKPVRDDEIASLLDRALDTPSGTGSRVTLAPHIARRLLGPPGGPGGSVHPVSTTLDRPLQQFAAEVLTRHLLAARDRRVQDGALLVADNTTGDVLAYVGGSGDLSSAAYVDGVRARRQAGSALKPFLYGLALERRLLTPASLLEDTPLDLPVTGGLFRPKNYDERFRGLVTLRTALAGSVNVPAVRTLDLVGVEPFVARLRRLGFVGLSEPGEYYGPSLALGSADVSLWELVNAYRTLANGGVWSPLRVTPDALPAPVRRLYSAATAFLVSDILADRESRSLTFGLENPLATPFWTAVKTGTSKEMRDNWCVGYSRRFTVGVWVGNFSGEPMQDVSGITGAAPVWSEVMAWLHRQVPSTPPRPPVGVRAQWVSFARGTEPDRMEWFLEGTEPEMGTPTLLAAEEKILSPAHGAVIALDPDIPPTRQRVLFEARADRRALRWVLDGADLGPGGDVFLWEPQPGLHVLSLAGEREQQLDAVTFEVRGTAPTARR